MIWFLVAWAVATVAVCITCAIDVHRHGPSDLWDEPFGGEIR